MHSPLHRRAFLVLAATTAAWCEDAIDSTGSVEREAVLDAREVRSGSGSAPAVRRTIGREEIARAASLASLLAREPGLVVRSAGGLGGYSVVSMRGAPTEQVEILLDGQPLGGSAGSTVDLGPIPLDALERVEIAQAGADGDGARPRIELTTRRDWSRAGVSARIGSFGEKALSGRWGDRDGRVSLSAWIEGADNDYEVPWNGGTSYDASDDRIVRLSNNDYSGRGAALAARPLPTLDLRLRVDDSRRGVSAPGWDDPDARLKATSVQADASWTGDSRDPRPEARASARWFRSEWSDPDKVSGYDVDRGSEEDGLDGRLAAALRRERSDWLDWRVGADVRVERSDRRSTGASDVAVTPSGTRASLGAEAGWAGRSSDAAFGAELSARGEWMRDSRDWTEDLGEVRTGDETETDWSGALFAGRAWARPLPRATVWIAGSRRIRPPDFREWMGDNGFTMRTPDLEVERTTSGEAGMRATAGPCEVSATGWIASYDDPIEAYQNGSSPLVAHRNAPGYRAFGLDATASVDAVVARLSASGTAQEARIDDPNPALDGNRPRRFPAWKGCLSVSSAPLLGASAGADVELQGSTYASELNRTTDRRDGRALLGSWIRWSRAGFSAMLSLRNLLDEHPADYEDVPLAGRQYALRIDFER